MIPAYNCAESIRHAVNSVLQQSVAVSEIVIVDDGSKDDTQQVVKELATQHPIVKVIVQANGGPGKARNTGIQNASGHWIAFLDSDDQWLPDRIEKQHQLIESSDIDLAWVGGRFVKITQHDNVIGNSPIASDIANQSSSVHPALELLAGSTSFWTGCFLGKKSAVKAVGGFCESMRTGEDADLWERLALQYPIVGFVKEPIARYVVAQNSSLTGAAARKISPSQYHHYERLIGYINDTPDKKSKVLLRRILQSKIDGCMKGFVRSGSLKQARLYTKELASRGFPSPDWKFRALILLPEWPIKLLRQLLGKG